MRFGIVPNLFVYENSVLKQHRRRLFSRVLLLNYGSIRAHASALVRDFSIAAPTLDTPVRALSGGNIQKLILGREISGEPALLVAAQETTAKTARSLFDLVNEANDQPTADLLTQRLDIHEKTAWMLRVLLDE